jgi:hypothetical protein
MDTIQIPYDTIDLLRDLFDQAYDNLDDAQWITNKEQLKKLYGIEGVDRVMQTKRGQPSSDVRKIIIDAVKEFDSLGLVKYSHINFARAFYPIAIHVDVPPPPKPQDGDTIIIPLTFNEQIKTVWWKGQVYNPVFDFWLAEQNYFSDKKKLNNLSKTYNLENAYWPKPDIVDYMELDGIGDWRKGTAFMGRRSQPHCSTNFLKSGMTHKDYILIQTNEVENHK